MSRSRSRSRLPAEPVLASIEDLTHEGRGVAHIDGKAVFIERALPGEQVRFVYTRRHASYDEGRLDEVLQASPDRVEPRCAHFGVCGGCSLQHLQADRQVEVKQRQMLEGLTRIGKVEPERVLAPLRAESWGYRRKARLGAKFVAKKGRVLVGFREQGAPYIADLQRCEVLDPRVGVLLPALGELIAGLTLRERVPQIEVAIGDNAVALSFRVLATPSAADLDALRAFGQAHDLQIYLQPQGPESTELLWPEQGELSYRLPGYDIELAFRPYHFTQVNTGINLQMVDLALDLLQLEPGHRVLDLFCGLGNFTLPLARRCREVVGVEGDRSLVDWAQRNARRNGVDNAWFHAADLAADVASQGWLKGGYDRVLLDPPRSGALEMMPHLGALAAERLVYVSCHPATLARDAGVLVHQHGYRLAAAGVMDMFPHTAHVESIALFERG